MDKVVIGVDVGGTKTTAALATRSGQIIKLMRVQTKREEGAEGGFKAICKMVQNLLEEAKKHELNVIGIGVGFGGPVDFERGVVYLSHHVHGWENFPLRAELEKRFGIATFVDNDANAGTLGEWMFGAGKGINDLLYVNIGTGIGGGIISGGSLVRGWKNLAGEIGHMTVNPNGPVCNCGRKGCLEALASGEAIGREGTKRFGRTMKSEEVFQLADQDNEIAKQIIAEAVEALAFAIGAAANLFNPKRVILGGGVGEAPEHLLIEPLKALLPRYTLPQSSEGLEIVRAQLGYDAGIMGAIALAITVRQE
ncbi:MAG: ROK family protein [Armatimonadetes bacterium]|nr:ROK family protein [Armatimonadota bacterium]MDW8027022.1 ROK family protein [Armatimonadota bacterium]